MKAIFLEILLMEKVLLYGKVVKNILGILKMEKNGEKDYLFILMVTIMKVIILMI